MVEPAAAAHGVALEKAETRCSFASVDDAGARTCRFRDEPGRERGDAGKTLYEIERHALGLQDGAGRALSHREDVPGTEAGGIHLLEVDGDGGIGESTLR